MVRAESKSDHERTVRLEETSGSILRRMAAVESRPMFTASPGTEGPTGVAPPGLSAMAALEQMVVTNQQVAEGYYRRVAFLESSTTRMDGQLVSIVARMSSNDPWQGWAGPTTSGAQRAPEPSARQEQQRPESHNEDRTHGRATEFNIHTPEDRTSRTTGRPWQLYDEKYLFQSGSLYDGKDPQKWLQNMHDYLAGRTRELDRIFAFIEQQTEPITRDPGFCIDSASNSELSHQLWALIGGLTKDHAEMTRVFRNVRRHNGFEAWRRMAEPINEDKPMLRQALLPLVTNPRHATSVDDVTKALEEWATNKRLFVEADGPLPPPEQERLAFIQLLPHEMNTYVSMHMEMYPTYDTLLKFTMKYMKVLQSQKRKPRVGVHLLDANQKSSEGSTNGEELGFQANDDDGDVEERVMAAAQIFGVDAADPETAAHLYAFMKGKFTRKGPTGGAAQKPFGSGLFGGGFRAAGVAPKPPPRGVQDMSCVNCGRKGHVAADCRQPKFDRKDQPCFVCGKKGHQARNCPDRPDKPAAKAIEQMRPPAAAFCVQTLEQDAEGLRKIQAGKPHA